MYLKSWHSSQKEGGNDATVGAGQSCTINYREEERATSLYKARQPVPPGSVPGPPLLPHWDFQTVSLCPPHLPSLWCKGSQSCLVFYCPIIISLPPEREGLHTWPYLTYCGDTLRWRRLPTAPFDAFFLGIRLKMPEPTKKGRSVDKWGWDWHVPSSSNNTWKLIYVLCFLNGLFNYLKRFCFHSIFARLLSLFEGSRVSCSIPSWLVCWLVHRNPQSDFDIGVVLLMHVCFSHPEKGCKRRFELCEQILLLWGVSIDLPDSSVWSSWRKTRWWNPVEECCWVPRRTQVKTCEWCCS